MTLRLRLTLAGIVFAFLSGLPLTPAIAAESLGLPNDEQLVTFKGTVVAIACEIAKDCPPKCGDGKRQLGLRTPDGKLLLAAKSTVDFMGSVRDLLPYCGRLLIVDGLTVSSGGTKLLMIQRYKLSDPAPWRPTNQSLIDWAKANQVAVDSEEAKSWMRNDKQVMTAVAKKGRLGVPEE
jgi:hypothetical protein